MTTPTLYRGGRIYSPAAPRATAMLVADGRIGWLGADADAPTAGTIVDLDGALVTPAFVDAHVHATDTGLTLLGLDLAGCASAGELLDAVAGYAAGLPADATLLGHGWDESGWADPTLPTRAALDAAAGGRRAYLARVDVHSALCSSALLAAAPHAAGRVGFDGDAGGGWQRVEAHGAVREVALAGLSAGQRADAQRAMLARAASLGIAAVHECGGPGTSDEADFTGLLALGRSPGYPHVFGYWGELLGAARARELGATGAGGDLYADGALGSQTARLRTGYADADTAGHAYLTAEQVTEHLLDCTAHGVQGGFHAIGDAALDAVVAGFAAAADKVGVDRIRAARHRVEHAELLDRELIRGLVEYGVVASVQPAFDRLWGGAAGMYATRLGVERALAANPIGALAGVGVALAFGSDSPVTPLDPWGAVAAAAAHHNPAHRLGVRAGFAAHTRGGWRAVHRDDAGVLAPGAPATFAAWDAPALAPNGLPDLAAGTPTCRRTVRDGHDIFEGPQ